MLLIPLGLDQSRGDQIDNAKNFESKGYGRHIPEDQLTEVNLLQELNDIELHRESIIKQMQTYQESYTKEDLFDKIIHDALNKGAPIMNRWKRISLLIVLHLFLV